jgi:hypothetical protein
VRSGLTVDAYDRNFRYRRGFGSHVEGGREQQWGQRERGGRGDGARETGAAATSSAPASHRSSNGIEARPRSSRSRSRSPPPLRRHAS